MGPHGLQSLICCYLNIYKHMSKYKLVIHKNTYVVPWTPSLASLGFPWTPPLGSHEPDLFPPPKKIYIYIFILYSTQIINCLVRCYSSVFSFVLITHLNLLESHIEHCHVCFYVVNGTSNWSKASCGSSSASLAAISVFVTLTGNQTASFVARCITRRAWIICRHTTYRTPP